MVQAIEFQSTIRDGVIEVPPALSERSGTSVRVIVLIEEPRLSTENAIDRLLKSPVSVTHFEPLTREEAHVR